MQMSTVRKIKCLKLYLSKQHQGQQTIFLRKRFEKMAIAANYNNNIYHELKYKTLKSVIPKKVELTAHRTFHFHLKMIDESIRKRKTCVRLVIITSKTCLRRIWYDREKNRFCLKFHGEPR